MENRQGAPSSSSPSSKAECKSCLGVLYFNQLRYGAQKPPVCMGLSSQLDPNDERVAQGHDSLPGGDFNMFDVLYLMIESAETVETPPVMAYVLKRLLPEYMCVGMSVYDEEELRQCAQRRQGSTDGVPLPQCTGVEYISAVALNEKPGFMTQGPPLERGGGADAATEASQSRPDASPAAPNRPGRTFGGFLSGSVGEVNSEQFVERFTRISQRMVAKMGSQLTYLESNVRRNISQMMKEWTGERGR